MKIVLIDDHELVRMGFVKLLNNFDRYELIGDFASVEEASASNVLEDCELLISDISLPGINGLDFLETFKDINPTAKLIIVSMHVNAYYIQRAKKLNVDAYLSKRNASAKLYESLNVVSQGGLYFDDLDNDQNLDLAEFETHQKLTDREKEVFLLLAKGNEIKQVAHEMTTAVSTVHAQRRSIMHKLNVAGSFQMTKFALKHGLIKPNDL